MPVALTKNPARQTVKAAKKAGKAIGQFTAAADQLEAASAEHLAVAEKAATDADKLEDEAFDTFAFKRVEAEKVYQSLLAAARDERNAKLDQVEALEALAEANEEAAFVAQQNADNIRGLLAVA